MRHINLSIAVLFLAAQLLAGCYRYAPLPESAAELDTIDRIAPTAPFGEQCDVISTLKQPFPEITFRRALCEQSPEYRCSLLHVSRACGQRGTAEFVKQTDRCIVDARVPILSDLDRTGTSVFPSDSERLQECGFSQERTTVGWILLPVQVVTVVPLYYLFQTIGCLVPGLSCPWRDNARARLEARCGGPCPTLEDLERDGR